MWWFLSASLAFSGPASAAWESVGLCAQPISVLEPLAGFAEDFSRHISLPPNLGPAVRTSALYGEDDRETVNPHRYPWNAVGQVSGPNGVCTAPIIGACYALADAHCFQNKDTGEDLEPTAFTFYSAGGGLTYAVSDFLTGGDWRQGANDYAVMQINTDLTGQQGWFGLNDVTGAQLAKEGTYNLAAYHADVAEGRRLVNQKDALVTDVDSSSKNKVYLKANTFERSSGGPLFFFSPDGGANVVGLNTSTVTQENGAQAHLPANTSDPTLLGRAIASHEFYANVVKFMDTHPCPAPKKRP